MLETLIEIGKAYGLPGILLVLILWILYFCYKLEKRMLAHETAFKATIKNHKEVHELLDEKCKKRTEHFSNTFDRIDELEKTDSQDVLRFENINLQLKTIGDNVIKIVDQLVTKGMK